MAIPKEKREMIASILNPEEMEELESNIGELSKQADGLESKESEEAKDVEEAKEEIMYVTQEEMVESVGAALGGFVAKLDALEQKIDGMENVVKELLVAEEERVAQTPAASVADMIMQRAIGSEDTRVDGRTVEAKQEPVLPAGFTKDGPTPSSLLNSFIAKSAGGP